jgi:hypothetical protein
MQEGGPESNHTVVKDHNHMSCTYLVVAGVVYTLFLEAVVHGVCMAAYLIHMLLFQPA